MRLLSLIVALILFSSILGQSDTLNAFTKKVLSNSAQDSNALSTPRVANDFQQIINHESSVFIKRQGPGGIASISVRGGSANQTQVFWNNIAINAPTLGQTDLSLIPMEFITDVVVTPGISGDGKPISGISGSLLLNNNESYKAGTGDRSKPMNSLRVNKDFGSFGIDNLAIIFKSKKRNFTNRTVALKNLADNNFTYSDYSQLNPVTEVRKNAFNSTYGLSQSNSWMIKKHQLNLDVHGLSVDRGVPVAIGVNPLKQTQTDEVIRSSLKWQWQKKQPEEVVLKLHGQLGWIYDRLRFQNKTALLDALYTTQNYFSSFKISQDKRQKRLKSAQLTHYHYQAVSEGFLNTANQNRTSLSLNWKEQIGYWKLDGHIRQELIDNVFTPIVVGGNITYIRNMWLIGANLGTNYRHPSLNDLYWMNGGNPNLKPERAFQGELLLKYKSNVSSNKKSKLSLGASLFGSEVDNWIQWVPNQTGNWSPENIKKVQKTGAEIQAAWHKPVNNKVNINLAGSYQIIDVQVVSSYSDADFTAGRTLIYTPKHIANGSFALRTKKWHLNYHQRFTDKLYIDNDNRVYLPYSVPADLEIGTFIKEKNTTLNISLQINNLFNEAYQVIANQPLPGRHMILKLTMNWN